MLNESQIRQLVDYCEYADDQSHQLLDDMLNGIEETGVFKESALQKMRFTDSDGNERTLLHIAVAKGNTNVVRVLLNHKFSPKTLDDDGNTSLHLACYADSDVKEEVVSMLLRAVKSSKSAFIDTLNAADHTALNNALYISKPIGHEIVKMLVSEGADVNYNSPLWNCFMKVRITKVDVDNFKFLLDKGADYLHTDGVVGNAMHRIASNGFTELAEILYSKGKQDHHIAELFKKTDTSCYNNKRVIEIARDERNVDRTADFQKWYDTHKGHIKNDIEVELSGDA